MNKKQSCASAVKGFILEKKKEKISSPVVAIIRAQVNLTETLTLAPGGHLVLLLRSDRALSPQLLNRDKTFLPRWLRSWKEPQVGTGPMRSARNGVGVRLLRLWAAVSRPCTDVHDVGGCVSGGFCGAAREERQTWGLPAVLRVAAAGARRPAPRLECETRCSGPSLQEFKAFLDHFNAQGCSGRGELQRLTWI